MCCSWLLCGVVIVLNSEVSEALTPIKKFPRSELCDATGKLPFGRPAFHVTPDLAFASESTSCKQAHWEAVCDGQSVWVSAIHVDDLGEAPGIWLWPGPALLFHIFGQ